MSDPIDLSSSKPNNLTDWQATGTPGHLGSDPRCGRRLPVPVPGRIVIAFFAKLKLYGF